MEKASSRDISDYLYPKIPQMCLFNATLSTNIIQTAFIFKFPYQGHYKTGANNKEGTGEYRILEKGVRNPNRRSSVVGSVGKFLKLGSSEMGFEAF